MTPSEIEDWLKTEKSTTVGQHSGDGEAIGHKSGQKIIDIKRTKIVDLIDAQYEHMQKVNAYNSPTYSAETRWIHQGN